MRKKVLIAIFLVLCSLHAGCARHGPVLYVLNLRCENKEMDFCFTVTNHPEEERFEIAFEGLNDPDNCSAFLSFSLNYHGTILWSLENTSNNETYPLVFSREDGKPLEYTDGGYAYAIQGKTTVYVSYAGLPEECKEFCRTFEESGRTDAEYSIFINNRLFTKD